jgi:hypothetical protein
MIHMFSKEDSAFIKHTGETVKGIRSVYIHHLSALKRPCP